MIKLSMVLNIVPQNCEDYFEKLVSSEQATLNLGDFIISNESSPFHLNLDSDVNINFDKNEVEVTKEFNTDFPLDFFNSISEIQEIFVEPLFLAETYGENWFNTIIRVKSISFNENNEIVHISSSVLDSYNEVWADFENCIQDILKKLR